MRCTAIVPLRAHSGVWLLLASVFFVLVPLTNSAQTLPPPRAPIEFGTESMSWAAGVAYSYDGSGNIRSIGSDDYVYDAAGRLVQSDVAGTRRNYEYDAFGNRTKCLQGVTDCQFGVTINPANNQNDASTTTYDPAGNVTQFYGHTYSYDALNTATSDVSGTTREYVYTADDERLAVYTVGGAWNWTVRDTSGKVLREFTSRNAPGGTVGTASWQWQKDYVWREGALLTSRQIDPISGFVTTYHYHLDHLGTPRRITDGENRIVGIHDDHAFGPEKPGGTNEPALTPLQFTGHERDLTGTGEPTTLDYMHARYYNPTLGRFLSVDPGGFDPSKPQSWNRYAYVMNNPIRYTDPDGRECGGCMAFERDARELQAGKITVQEYNARLTARGVGAAIGGAIVGGFFLIRAIVDVASAPDIGPEEVPRPSEPYNRQEHYGSTPTAKDRKDLGAGSDEVVNHEPPLVKRFYEGDPATGEKPGHQMTPEERRQSATDRSRMNLQPKKESCQQGADCARYSREKKKEHDLNR
jgi:RHS repeat-associated protein